MPHRPPPLVIALMLALTVGVLPHAVADACEPAIGAHYTGATVHCRAAGHGLILVAGDHQSVACDEPNGNVVVIVGDDNTVQCAGSNLAATQSAPCEPVAIAVAGTASSCGFTIVALGSGSGKVVIVVAGRASGGTIAIVVYGCASQNEEGIAIGVINTCGQSIVPPTPRPLGVM